MTAAIITPKTVGPNDTCQFCTHWYPAQVDRPNFGGCIKRGMRQTYKQSSCSQFEYEKDVS